MPEIGYASMPVVATFKGLQNDLERGSSKALTAAGASGGTKFGDAAGKSAGQRFGSIFRTAAKATLLGVLGGGALAVKFGADAVSAASDLAESQNKVQQVFGKGSDNIFKFTAKAAKALGQTNQEARDAAATFGIFGKVAKLSDKENAKFAIHMDKLASDLASFHNTSPQQAIEAIGAAMRGEAEPIRAYGVLLDEATLKAEALRIGLLKPVKDKAKIQGYQVAVLEAQKKYNEAVKDTGKQSLETLKADANLGTARDRLKKATEGTIPPLTAQQKVLAAQSSILQQTKVAQGDFARTSGGLANQQRILSASFENTKAKIGKALLPAITGAVKYINQHGIPALNHFSDWFNDKGVPAISGFVDKAKPIVKTWLPKIGDGFKTAGGYAKTAAGFAGDVVDAFDNMPGWVKKILIGGTVGGLAAKKLGLGSLLGSTKSGGLGGGSGLLGLISKAKPVPVFVTNPGGIGGGGGGIGGKVGKVGKVGLLAGAGTVGLASAIAGGITLGVGKAIGKDTRESLAASGGQGVGLNADSHFFDLDDEDIKTHNKLLSKTQDRWVDARLASKDYAFQVHNGIPRSALTTVTNWTLENKKAREYISTLLEARSIVIDNRLDRAGGSGTTPGSGFDPSNGTRPHGRPRSERQVVQNFNGPIRFNDQKEFSAWSQRKSVTAFSTGGF